MHHGPELVIVATVCAVLLLGLATKVVSRLAGLPYTVLVLLTGLLVGLALPPQDLVATGEQVSPDLILFVFLPVLVFESAFSMQLHRVRRNLGAVLWLAGPAMVASTFGVAAWMVFVTQGSWGWGWVPALVFGALISATDPVAVVALLRELGAPKRLAVLIEGESLFNDGTSIVVFSLLLGVLAGHGDIGPIDTVARFVVVAGGGVLVGGGLAMATSQWLQRTFNQPVVEITLTLALAYLSMVVAESLHVSGVMAVVVAGLWMSGPGRVHISPEVGHFLHRFWQVLASIANTLIFFLVGLVVAESIGHVGVDELLVVASAFVGIVVLRGGLVAASRPVMSWLSGPISAGEGVVMAWGGLRGAVSLALALMVAQEHSIPEQLREQILLVTAGVVLGTLCINGTTIGWLLGRLGFAEAPPGDRLAQAATRTAILDAVAADLATARATQDMRTVNWKRVEEELVARRGEVERVQRQAESELASGTDARVVGAWRQALRMERTAVWDAFARGTLSATAVQILDANIDARQHAVEHGDLDALSTGRGEQLPGWRGAVERWLNAPGRTFGTLRFRLLELRYELARGRRVSASTVIDALERREIDAEELRDAYVGRRQLATRLLEDMRANLPEVTEALETRVARRISLNLEREAVARLEAQGALDPDSATRARSSIEERMKQVASAPRAVALPETPELCRGAPLFAGVDEESIQRIATLTTEKALAPDEVLFEQGTTGGNLFILARGAVAVLREDDGETLLLDVLGSGDVMGEMELLTGEPRTATIRAMTTCIVGEIDRKGFEELMAEVPAVAERVRRAFAQRRFDNHVRRLPAFASMGHSERVEWFERGQLRSLCDGESCAIEGLVFVVNGALQGWSRHQGPALVRPEGEDQLTSVGATTVVELPRGPADAPLGDPPPGRGPDSRVTAAGL